MARAEKNIHYLYKTTCLITGRWYIGMHSTSNLDDGYMGSGKRLRYSIRKHGLENHVKEILEFFENRGLLIEAEKKAITSEMITDKNCMNLTGGGNGGHGSRFLSKEQLSKGGKNSIKKILHIMWVENELENKTRMAKQSKEYWNDCEIRDKMMTSARFNGKTHSDETKQKMRKSKNNGSDNSQYGTCWITKDGVNKKIKKEEIEKYTKNGWVKGRKIN